MQTSYQLQPPSHPYRGIAIVVAIHIVLGWALISGTASQGLTLLMKPLEAVVIQEVAIQPPPPEPKAAKPLASKKEAPPPPFMPQVEAPAPATAVAQIEAAPTPPVVVQPVVPAPPPAPPAPPAQVHTDIAIVCPVQVPPEMPRRALIDGTQGAVKAQATIQNGIVRSVAILSGPRIFHDAVRSAMLKYKCTSGTGEVVAIQDFNFRLQ